MPRAATWRVWSRHEQRRRALGEDAETFYSRLKQGGEGSVKPGLYTTDEDPLSLTRFCDLDVFKCFSKHTVPTVSYSKYVCKALTAVATWNVRTRGKENDHRMTVRILLPEGHQPELKPEAVMAVLGLFFTSLTENDDGQYELPLDRKPVIMKALQELHPLVGAQVNKQFVEEDDHDHPATPEPELDDQDSQPWYYRTLQMLICPSNTKKIWNFKAMQNMSTQEIERLARWSKLPMPFGSQLNCGNIWVASSQA
jgi:hypothetical protein